MIQNNYFTDNEDLQFHFDLLAEKKEIIDEYEHGFADAAKYKETGDEKLAYAPSTHEEALDYYRTILENVGDLSGNQFSQAARELDEIGLKYKDGKVEFPKLMVENYNKFTEAGLLPYALKRENNGLGLPVSIITILVEVLARADIGFGMTFGVNNLSEVIEKYGSEEQKAKWLPKMASGEYTGAMALSEPNFGSDLSSVMTKAVKQDDGTYRLTGTKRYITHGCGMAEAPSAILTLARTGSPESGARGLSFFIVDSKDIEVIGIEHKLGLKCSPTCEIAYENSPAELIGEEGRGLTKFAMGMMNGARLGVGNLSVGNATAAYYEAVKYAEEREQFGKKIKDIPAVKKILDKMEREVAAMRCLNMEAAYSIDMYHWRSEHLLESGKSEREVRKDAHVQFWDRIATLFTPLCKYYSSEVANQLAYDCIQIHGGAGFTEDYDAARIYRDSRILSIYEGTTQLQMLAAIGGVTAGMSATGYLRKYLEELTAQFEVSEDSQKLREIFEKAIDTYKSIEKSEDKSLVAFEMVDLATRYINGLLLEHTASRLEGEKKAKRLQLCEEYNIDSLGIAASHVNRLERTAAKSGSEKLELVAG